MANIEVDSRSVLKMFAELNSKNQKKVHRLALAKALNILVKEARSTLKGVIRKSIYSKSKKTGKSLASGIKYKINKDATEGKVHILGDFRLKFFELGTKERYRKRGGKTGSIKASYFFRIARQNNEAVISSSMNNIIAESIRRVNGKFKNR